jgi:hypothetical protein
MLVTFYKGALRTKDGSEIAVSWAETDFGVMGLASGSEDLVHEIDTGQITVIEPIAAFDLPGLDSEGVEVVVGSILKGKYLDMPGVKGKGEAVLFVLVNEALHQLAEIAKYNYEE